MFKLKWRGAGHHVNSESTDHINAFVGSNVGAHRYPVVELDRGLPTERLFIGFNPEVYLRPGDSLVWDGTAFSVESDLTG